MRPFVRFLPAAVVVALVARPAAAFDTYWHSAASAGVAQQFGFTPDTTNILQVGTFGPDLFGPAYDQVFERSRRPWRRRWPSATSRTTSAISASPVPSCTSTTSSASSIETGRSTTRGRGCCTTSNGLQLDIASTTQVTTNSDGSVTMSDTSIGTITLRVAPAQTPDQARQQAESHGQHAAPPGPGDPPPPTPPDWSMGGSYGADAGASSDFLWMQRGFGGQTYRCDGSGTASQMRSAAAACVSLRVSG